MKTKFRGWTGGIVALALAGTLAACTGQEAAVDRSDNPVTRKVSWFGYLDGDDMRPACKAGAPDQYRFVYNGVYVDQVRTYDVKADPSAGSATMRSRIFGNGDVSQLAASGLSDLLSPWRGEVEHSRLDADQMKKLKDAMSASGVFAGAPKGLNMNSYEFYWVVDACVDGHFHFNAYRWPSDRFDHVAFGHLLLSWDPIKVPLNPPHQVLRYQYISEGGGSHPENLMDDFNITVGNNGLVGVRSLF